MEFQFGTNWAEFSKTAGGVIWQTPAMEGIFSFFLESSVCRLMTRCRIMRSFIESMVRS
jgi:cytochrome bd ubiquinol oxidase subunit I